MEGSTVSLAELEGGCCPDGMARRISGSPDTCSVFEGEVLGILSKMSLSADFFELAFQERPSVYSADTGWKSDSDRFEAYCNERRQANRAACQGSTRVR